MAYTEKEQKYISFLKNKKGLDKQEAFKKFNSAKERGFFKETVAPVKTTPSLTDTLKANIPFIGSDSKKSMKDVTKRVTRGAETFVKDTAKKVYKGAFSLGADINKLQTGRTGEDGPIKEGILGRSVPKIKKLGSKMVETGELYSKGKISAPEEIAQVTTAIGKAGIDLFGDAVVSAVSTVAPEKLKDAGKQIVQKIIETETGQSAVKKVSGIQQDIKKNISDLRKAGDIKKARRYEAVFDGIEGVAEIATSGIGLKGAKVVKEGAEAGIKGGIRGVERGVDTFQRGIRTRKLRKLGEMKIRDTGKLEKVTRRFEANNPYGDVEAFREGMAELKTAFREKRIPMDKIDKILPTKAKKIKNDIITINNAIRNRELPKEEIKRIVTEKLKGLPHADKVILVNKAVTEGKIPVTAIEDILLNKYVSKKLPGRELLDVAKKGFTEGRMPKEELVRLAGEAGGKLASHKIVKALSKGKLPTKEVVNTIADLIKKQPDEVVVWSLGTVAFGPGGGLIVLPFYKTVVKPLLKSVFVMKDLSKIGALEKALIKYEQEMIQIRNSLL